MTMTDTASVGAEAVNETSHSVEIDFLYIDLYTCRRCGGTDTNLDQAIALTRPALAAAGIDLTLTKTLIESSAEAVDHRPLSSPTIRIGGADIAGEFLESNCADCGSLSACGDSTDCRVWLYRGEEHTAAPTGLIVEAILAAAAGVVPVAEPYLGLPENLERFFDGTATEATEVSDCGCGSACS